MSSGPITGPADQAGENETAGLVSGLKPGSLRSPGMAVPACKTEAEDMRHATGIGFQHADV